MRKLLIFCVMLLSFVGMSARADVCFLGCDGKNPFTGNDKNQVAIYAAQGVNNGFLIPPPFQLIPFHFLQLQYSQPTTFFRIPARQSINFGQTIGSGKKYGWKWDEFTIPMIFLSEDVPLIYGDHWYLAVGAGGGLQAQQNERIGSKWLFQFKAAIGVRFTRHATLELFVQHFSNGNTAPENNSYGFYGAGFAYSF